MAPLPRRSRKVALLSVQQVSVTLRYWLKSQAPMLCAMTICALFLCAAQVSSKQAPAQAEPHAVSDPFALKNPNAFDPARRRSVRAMKVPLETAEHLARGIDAAEAQPDLPDVEDGDTAASRMSLNTR
jgi:hypothetical protein